MSWPGPENRRDWMWGWSPGEAYNQVAGARQRGESGLSALDRYTSTADVGNMFFPPTAPWYARMASPFAAAGGAFLVGANEASKMLPPSTPFSQQWLADAGKAYGDPNYWEQFVPDATSSTPSWQNIEGGLAGIVESMFPGLPGTNPSPSPPPPGGYRQPRGTLHGPPGTPPPPGLDPNNLDPYWTTPYTGAAPDTSNMPHFTDETTVYSGGTPPSGPPSPPSNPAFERSSNQYFYGIGPWNANPFASGYYGYPFGWGGAGQGNRGFGTGDRTAYTYTW